MGDLLTVASMLQCPHGFPITAVSSNSRAKADGAYILRSSDTFVPACTDPQKPCTSVQWVSFALRTKADSDSALTTDSVGLCIGPSGPNGNVSITSAQSRASGQ